ncbi:hypothetical protein POX_a00877 [Penicillium oxalicum]|uniref:hypothetical protein n=1 Tax=Penicillium oxalicum TaxID=69781 RepID=UPI0020B6ED89|nr:hypothetical protein POX_a00877 [Penicillium oxalicum]KAI2794285.1 hypothetical protein POX_a00877 [Penicillium oxalicum]
MLGEGFACGHPSVVKIVGEETAVGCTSWARNLDLEKGASWSDAGIQEIGSADGRTIDEMEPRCRHVDVSDCVVESVDDCHTLAKAIDQAAQRDDSFPPRDGRHIYG